MNFNCCEHKFALLAGIVCLVKTLGIKNHEAVILSKHRGQCMFLLLKDPELKPFSCSNIHCCLCHTCSQSGGTRNCTGLVIHITTYLDKYLWFQAGEAFRSSGRSFTYCDYDYSYYYWPDWFYLRGAVTLINLNLLEQTV